MTTVLAPLYTGLTHQQKELLNMNHKNIMTIIKNIMKKPYAGEYKNDPQWYDLIRTSYEKDWEALLQDQLQPTSFIKKYWIDQEEMDMLIEDYKKCWISLQQKDHKAVSMFIKIWGDNTIKYNYTAEGIEKAYRDAKRSIYRRAIKQFIRKAEAMDT